jgi:hypothetical protein
MSWQAQATEKLVSVVVNNTSGAVRRGVISNILAGMGMSYALNREDPKYGQAALAFWAPSMYAGYHIYKYRDVLLLNIKKSADKVKTG